MRKLAWVIGCLGILTVGLGGEALAAAQQAGKTSCAIERGEGGEDWIVRIKHERGAKGAKTAPCKVVERVTPPSTSRRDAARPGADGPPLGTPSQPR